MFFVTSKFYSNLKQDVYYIFSFPNISLTIFDNCKSMSQILWNEFQIVNSISCHKLKVEVLNKVKITILKFAKIWLGKFCTWMVLRDFKFTWLYEYGTKSGIYWKKCKDLFSFWSSISLGLPKNFLSRICLSNLVYHFKLK